MSSDSSGDKGNSPSGEETKPPKRKTKEPKASKAKGKTNKDETKEEDDEDDGIDEGLSPLGVGDSDEDENDGDNVGSAKGIPKDLKPGGMKRPAARAMKKVATNKKPAGKTKRNLDFNTDNEETSGLCKEQCKKCHVEPMFYVCLRFGCVSSFMFSPPRRDQSPSST